MSPVEWVQIVSTVVTVLTVLFLAGSWKGRNDASGKALEKRLSAIESRADVREHEMGAEIARHLKAISDRMDRASAQYSDLSSKVQGVIGRLIRVETKLDLPSRERQE